MPVRGYGDQRLPVSTCPHCKGVSFHAAQHIEAVDTLHSTPAAAVLTGDSAITKADQR